ALYGEIVYLDEHLEDAAYCVLNSCRILYSFVHRDVVVSKRAAAEWALLHLPEEDHPLIHGALRAYQDRASTGDRAALTSGATDVVRRRRLDIAALDPSDNPTPERCSAP